MILRNCKKKKKAKKFQKWLANNLGLYTLNNHQVKRLKLANKNFNIISCVTSVYIYIFSCFELT
ncbi:hypothetical protein Hanom_Chr17g01582391 [Helianthus anomalus]